MLHDKRLVLIDGHALAYRAYFALMRRGFSTRDGQPTGAVYGFTKTLLEVIRTFQPGCLAVSFDRPKRTFRHESFAEYKAHRKPMENDLISQMAPIREVVRAFEIPIYELDGYEADDVIGTLARRASEAGFEVLIVTGDRDAFQLVDEHVKVVLPRSGEGDLQVYGPAEVLAKMGVTPAQIPDMKGLMGDASDNIPGVPGIGEKGAVKLLGEFGTLDNLYAHVEEVTGKTKDKLKDNEPLARLSLQLATIDRDVPVDFELGACRLTVPNLDQLTSVLMKLEFATIIKQLPTLLATFAPAGGAPLPVSVGAGTGPDAASKAEPNTLFAAAGVAVAAPEAAELNRGLARPLDLDLTIVDDAASLDKLASALAAASSFTYDVETDSLKSVSCRLVGLAIAVGGPEAKDCRCFYVPVAHDTGAQLPWEQVLKVIAPHFADANKTKVAHNAKFDINVLVRHGVTIEGLSFDTMIADYLVFSGRESHALKELGWEHLRYEMTDIKRLIGSGAKAITMAQVGIEQAAPYAAADVAVTSELREFLGPKLVELGADKLFWEMELPLVRVLVEMEQTGVKLDVPYLQALSVRLGDRIAELETRIHELAGESFNINSPKQLGVILFEKLQLPVIKRTKTGPSTDAEVLEELKDSHDVVAGILEYRGLVKLKSTYVDALPQLINPKTGKVHTSFNQTVAETGRLSSSDPNFQNIPIRTELGREIRRAFVPSEPHCVIVSADYSQIELRILAHITQDPSFLRAFREDLDIHAVTASEIFGVPLEAVTADQRRRAKTTNFGIVYGQTDYGLSKALGIGRKEAREFIDAFNARYPGVQRYVTATLIEAKRQGYVETLSGRRRYIPQVNASNRNVRDWGERMAINAPIQGTSADIIKLAMVRLAPKLPALESRMILQVHDELVFEAPSTHLEALKRTVKETMEGAFSLDVPLKVDVHAGASWMDAK